MTDDVRKLAGNWQRFDSFGWDRASELREAGEADSWGLYYTHNRDSGIAELSNAACIEREMRPFSEGTDPDVIFESHGHWAVGHIDGFSIRVFRNGELTPAATKLQELLDALSDYPILDDSDYSDRECKAIADYWEFMSLKERVRVLGEHGACIFAARRDDVPQDERVWEYLREAVQ